jgi:hypothetical protein
VTAESGMAVTSAASAIAANMRLAACKARVCPHMRLHRGDDLGGDGAAFLVQNILDDRADLGGAVAASPAALLASSPSLCAAISKALCRAMAAVRRAIAGSQGEGARGL